MTIDWPNKIIHVDKADTTQVQLTPSEIRELDLDWFRRKLRDLEDDPSGMPYLRTHKHNTEVTLGGITYSRVIEIINGYTITFEDGNYAVRLVGANSNVEDVVNVNQVSVRSNNSAGLISLPLLVQSSFDGFVTVDVVNGTAGTKGSSSNPIGTQHNPVDNISDALTIASDRSLREIFIIGDATLTTGHDLSNFIIRGQGADKSTITVDNAATVTNVTFKDCTVTGTLGEQVTIENCIVNNIADLYGEVRNSELSGTITIKTSADIIDSTGSPTIDLGGSGNDLILRRFAGEPTIQNKTGTETVYIDVAGEVKIDDTVTAGTVVLSGDGIATNNGTDITGGQSTLNGATIINNMVLGVMKTNDGVINRNVKKASLLVPASEDVV